MLYLANKFARTMELRSSRYYHLLVDFVEKFNRQNGSRLYVESESYSVSNDYLSYTRIRDIVRVKDNSKNILTLVNSNFKYCIENVVDVLRAYQPDPKDFRRGAPLYGKATSPNWKQSQILSLANYLGLENEFTERAKSDPVESFKQLLDIANKKMSGFSNFYSGANSVSFSGMLGTKDYIEKVNDPGCALEKTERVFAGDLFNYVDARESKHVEEE